MKVLSLVLLLLASLCRSSADSWGAPSPSGYSSPSGKYVLRILPGDSQAGKKSLALVFEIASNDDKYNKRNEFPLVNARAPVDACISDQGEVITFDDWGMMGYEHVIVWYTANGKTHREYQLLNLFPAPELLKIREKHTTKSSVHWRRDRPYFNGPILVIPVSLGGYITIINGKTEYFPSKQR